MSVPDSSTAPAPPMDAGTAAGPDAGPSILPSPAAPAGVVLNFGGDVEIRRAGTDEWFTLKVGESVTKGDAIRTKNNGHVELSFDVGNMTLREGSQVILTFLDADSVQTEVAGRAEGTAVEGKGRLSMGAAGSDVVATVAGGQVSLFADGRGTAAVAAMDGKAEVKAGAETVELGKGQFTARRGPRGLSRAALAPKRIALKVGWPVVAETNKGSLVLKGKASDYSQVLVQGERVELSPDGTFSAEVPLKRGRQRIVVVVVDVLGRRAVDSRVVTMDPDAPDIKANVQYR